MKSLQGTWLGWQLDSQRTSISGWTEMSVTPSTANWNQLPLGFNYLANQFLLQANWLRFQRTVVTSGTEPTFGYRIDAIVPGSDYRFTTSRGLFDSQDVSNNPRYGFDVTQAYAEAYFPTIAKGLDIKLGKFFVMFGAESLDSAANPLASYSYSFIYDPFCQTGIVGTLNLTDDWSVSLGRVTGNDVFLDPAASPTVIAGVKWAPPKGRYSANLNVVFGRGKYDVAEQFNNPQIVDLVLTARISERLTYTFDGIYGYQTDVPEMGFANWFGLVHYLTWQLSPKLSTTGRLEFFDDIQGQRTGYAGLYTAATAGLQYRPQPWLILRPELRIDHNDSRPFEGKPTLGTMCLDAIIRW